KRSTKLSTMSFGFRVTHADGRARRGVLRTAHGDVETPAFMPVGTQGAVKGVTNRDLEALGAEILLSNTYHLYLRPGDDLMARRGRDRFLALRETRGAGQAQFGIVQGGVYPELREESAYATVAIGFDAYAIGGLSVGEPVDVMYDIVSHTTRFLPDDRPRYLMGTGTPEDLVESAARGIDLFDCVLPTRNARNGQLFTSEGRINIKNARYAEDDRPPD